MSQRIGSGSKRVTGSGLGLNESEGLNESKEPVWA